MIGLIVLSVLFVYIMAVIVSARLAYKLRGIKQWIAIVFLLSIVLIPTWDIPLDLYRFNKLCKEESGIFVYQKVGLPAEYFYTKGEPIKKYIYREDSGFVLRTVPATGNELKLEKLKQHYRIEIRSEENFVDWSADTYRSTTTVWDGEKLLGKSVRLYGGAGWFSETINWSPVRQGYWCPPPKKIKKIDRQPLLDAFIYDIFYKTNEDKL